MDQDSKSDKKLHEILIQAFNLEELNNLCREQGINPELIQDRQTIKSFAWGIIDFHKRRSMQQELIKYVISKRPHTKQLLDDNIAPQNAVEEFTDKIRQVKSNLKIMQDNLFALLYYKDLHKRLQDLEAAFTSLKQNFSIQNHDTIDWILLQPFVEALRKETGKVVRIVINLNPNEYDHGRWSKYLPQIPQVLTQAINEEDLSQLQNAVGKVKYVVDCGLPEANKELKDHALLQPLNPLLNAFQNLSTSTQAHKQLQEIEKFVSQLAKRVEEISELETHHDRLQELDSHLKMIDLRFPEDIMMQRMLIQEILNEFDMNRLPQSIVERWSTLEQQASNKHEELTITFYQFCREINLHFWDVDEEFMDFLKYAQIMIKKINEGLEFGRIV